MEGTYYVIVICNKCSRKATLIGYEKVTPEEVVNNYIERNRPHSRDFSHELGRHLPQ